MKKRVSLVLSTAVDKTLRDLADRRASTLSATVRDALRLFAWYEDVLDNGGRVFVRERNGRIHEVTPR